MKMQKLINLIIAVIISSLSLSVSAAYAITIDFTDDAWEDGDGLHSYTIGDVTVTATPRYARLWHDSTDGMGIRYSYEDDEIEGREMLKVSFASNINLDTIGLSDLFYESRSGHWYNEIGYYSLNDGVSWTQFIAPDSNLPSPATNGELSIAIGGIKTDSIWLKAHVNNTYTNYFYRQDHEFALQRLDISQVPEPSTLILLGSGLAGVALLGKKRLIK